MGGGGGENVYGKGSEILFVFPRAAAAGADAVSTLRKTSVWRGASVTIPCHYEDKYKSHVKYWCSGYSWTSCESLKRTDSLITQSDKVSISDDPAQEVFTVTMRGLVTGDSGWYWCAVEIGGYGTPDDRASLYLTVTEGMILKQHMLEKSLLCNCCSELAAQRLQRTAVKLCMCLMSLSADAAVLYVVNATVTGQIGGEVSVQCRYGHPYRSRQKQRCRSGDWTSFVFSDAYWDKSWKRPASKTDVLLKVKAFVYFCVITELCEDIQLAVLTVSKCISIDIFV
ncbi:uncharacterized protein LOC136712151 [Amia ocellicauda]|uniref:uncharacterized protein LOC136712151 n=1 Tax=Amia ocellicauda TaxID=2972642 RepID=UPI003464A00A